METIGIRELGEAVAAIIVAFGGYAAAHFRAKAANNTKGSNGIMSAVARIEKLITEDQKVRIRRHEEDQRSIEALQKRIDQTHKEFSGVLNQTHRDLLGVLNRMVEDYQQLLAELVRRRHTK